MKKTERLSRRSITILILALGVNAVFCLSLHYHFLNPLFYITSHAKGQGGPFFGIYQAGVNLRCGDSIYGCDSYSAPRNVVVPYYHFYRYLPFASYVSSVVSKVLKPWPAYWLWVVTNEILLGICILFTMRLRAVYGTAAVAVSAFWLLYSPMYIELYLGQFCFTMTCCMFFLLYPYIKQRSPSPNGGQVAASVSQRPTSSRLSALASVSWIMTVLIKSFTILYTFTFFKIGKRKLAIAGIAVAAVTSAPYFLRHAQDLRYFLHLNLQPLPPHLTGGCFGFSGLMRDVCNDALPFLSVNVLRFKFFDVAVRNIPLMALAASITLTTLFITLKQKTIDPLANITLWTLTFFLIFKDIWEYHYVMLIPLFVAYYLQTRSKFLLTLFIVLALPTPFIFYDVAASEDPQAFWSVPLSLLHHSFKAIPTFLFYLWVVKRELGRTGLMRGAETLEEEAP
jgi:hypothetical protein